MNKIYTYIIILGVFSAIMASCTSRQAATEEKPQGIDTIPHIVTQVQKCSRLYTAECKIHKIITHNDEIRVKGKLLSQSYDIALPVGTRQIAIPIDATVKAYIDFGDFSEKNVRREGGKIEIILPDPHIQLTSTKISHAEIKKHVALLRRNFSDKELADYERQGRDAIIKDIPGMGIDETARTGAAKIIVPIFTSLGFKEKDITVTFRKDLTKGDLSKMIDPTTTIEGK